MVQSCVHQVRSEQNDDCQHLLSRTRICLLQVLSGSLTWTRIDRCVFSPFPFAAMNEAEKLQLPTRGAGKRQSVTIQRVAQNS